MGINHILFLFLQSSLIAFAILLLFHLRKQLGIGVLYACLGLFQFIQVLLSSTFYVEIAESLIVSPGPSIMFTSTLFAILIIYIKEDALETKKIIYGLVIINILMTILSQILSWEFQDKSSIINPHNLSTDIFDISAWDNLGGTFFLLIDSLLIIITYEFISKYIPRLFFQILFPILLVVSFDAISYTTVTLWHADNFENILISSLISKGVVTLYYSILFYLYLKYFDDALLSENFIKKKDVFQPLSYKQKFEAASINIEQKSQEIDLKDKQYKTLTKISPVGIFRTRSDGYTTFLNDRWTKITGLKKQDGYGWGWLTYIHPDDKKLLENEWDLAIKEKRNSKANFRFLLKDGSIKWVLGETVPEFDSENEIIGFVGTITDITELKLFQEEQIVLRKKAEESDRLKSAFLANMSHEIRTPMNGILGFTDLMLNPDLSEQSKDKYIKIIQQSGKRLLNTVDDIIEISKIEAGIITIHDSVFNLNKVMTFSEQFFQQEAWKKGLEFKFENHLSSKNITIKTDQGKFEIILNNLIKNAIKYTDSGHITVSCKLRENFIEFCVADSGIGIPENRQIAVFNRFEQADIADERAFQGSGLGLAISKSHAELLGGKIWLESEPNKGSKFFFTIPYDSKQNAPITIKDTDASEDDKKPANKFNFLIVEDDKVSSILLQTIVKNIANKITVASNGIEAIEACKEHADLDIILMDVKMPEMNGFEAIREIRKFNKEVIIIMQTAYAMAGDKEKALEAGSNDYISKPINRNKLFQKIDLLLEKK